MLGAFAFGALLVAVGEESPVPLPACANREVAEILLQREDRPLTVHALVPEVEIRASVSDPWVIKVLRGSTVIASISLPRTYDASMVREEEVGRITASGTYPAKMTGASLNPSPGGRVGIREPTTVPCQRGAVIERPPTP